MGGTVAQLVWKRHAHRVAGLVLAATSGHFVSERKERVGFTVMAGIGALSRIVPASVRESISHRLYVSRKTMTWEPWAAKEASGHEWRLLLEAGAALGLYDARHWLPHVDVPTSMIITTQDHVVATERQRELADLVPNIHVQTIDADHDAVYAHAEKFVPMLVNACLHVAQRFSQQNMPEESSK